MTARHTTSKFRPDPSVEQREALAGMPGLDDTRRSRRTLANDRAKMLSPTVNKVFDTL